MASYATSQIDAIIATLEAGLGTGEAEIQDGGRKITYRTVADIRNAITYFRGLYPAASDAPANPAPKIRTFLFYGNPGF